MIRDIRLRHPAFIQDRRDRRARIDEHRISGFDASALLPVDFPGVVKCMHDVKILRIRRHDPFLRRPDLLLLLPGSRHRIALVDPLTDLLKRNRPIQQDGDPAAAGDVIPVEISRLPDDHVHQHRISQLQINDIHIICALHSQLLPLHVHDQREPFPVVRMAQDRIGRSGRERIIRFNIVFFFYVLKYFFSH